MHWYIPTNTVDANEGGTFFVNACSSDGQRHTEDPKKITCKVCKAIYRRPRTPIQAAAKVLQQVITEQEEGRKSDFFVTVQCNACPNDVDTFGWYESVEQHHEITKMINLLEHCAFEHVGGAEVLFIRHYTPMSVYELNLAMGKPAMTTHEERWREDENIEAKA
jgi:hypothetical protein